MEELTKVARCLTDGSRSPELGASRALTVLQPVQRLARTELPALRASTVLSLLRTLAKVLVPSFVECFFNYFVAVTECHRNRTESISEAAKMTTDSFAVF